MRPIDGAVAQFRHDKQEHQERAQPERQPREGDELREHAEQRRHEGRTQIGERHLHADDGLGILRAEVGGRRVDDGGVDGRAAKPDDEEARHGGVCSERQREQDKPDGDDARADTDEHPIAQLFRDKPA